jgi:multicomponent Na+:H+ antiporter subunit C
MIGVIDTTPSLALVLVAGVCVGTGVYLLLERSLSRVIIGIILIGNGVNVMFLVAGGRAGGPPLVGTSEPEQMSDPLVQAMVLTAIVITLGLSAFVLAMAYRSWQLHGHDEVQDDLEDRRIAERLRRDGEDGRADIVTDLEVEAAEARDETEDDEPFDEPVKVAADGGRLAGDRAARGEDTDTQSENGQHRQEPADEQDEDGGSGR